MILNPASQENPGFSNTGEGLSSWPSLPSGVLFYFFKIIVTLSTEKMAQSQYNVCEHSEMTGCESAKVSIRPSARGGSCSVVTSTTAIL